MCWKLDFFPTCEQQLPWIRCASPSRHRTFSLAVLFLLTVFVSDISQAAFSTTEMALALNRYLCSAVLPLITKCAPLFAGTDHRAIMIDSMLHTIYRLSRGRSLTKAQRDVIEECLMSLCKSVYIENSWLYTQQCEGFGLFVFHYSGDVWGLFFFWSQVSAAIDASTPSEKTRVWCAHSQWVCQNAPEGTILPSRPIWGSVDNLVLLNLIHSDVIKRLSGRISLVMTRAIRWREKQDFI